jgi:predicted regulator of Ras-like GTPase activity (Roadblock/LC7/MglB family)
MPRGRVVAEVDEQRRAAEVRTRDDIIIGAMEHGSALVVLARPEADLGDLLYLIRRVRPAVTDAL